MLYISLRSVVHALKERHCWSFCAAAMAIADALPVGPNLRRL